MQNSQLLGLVLAMLSLVAFGISAYGGYRDYVDVKISENTVYSEVKHQEILGVEYAKKPATFYTISCESKEYAKEEDVPKVNASKGERITANPNGTREVCANVSYTDYIPDTSKPTTIYAPAKTIKIIAGGVEYDFDTKGCWVCGEYVACLSQSDGFAENRADVFKCDAKNIPIFRSGESGYVVRISDGKKIKERSDVGKI